ncbi:MAG TPA: glycine betaine ABC transporter substrate-binding protein, partial [Egibacteraceae bacterium]
MPAVRARRTIAALAVVVAAGAGLSLASGASEADIVVGVGSTVEQRVLAALTVAALDDAGVTVEARTGLGGTVGLRREALGGEIDLFW